MKRWTKPAVEQKLFFNFSFYYSTIESQSKRQFYTGEK